MDAATEVGLGRRAATCAWIGFWFVAAIAVGVVAGLTAAIVVPVRGLMRELGDDDCDQAEGREVRVDGAVVRSEELYGGPWDGLVVRLCPTLEVLRIDMPEGEDAAPPWVAPPGQGVLQGTRRLAVYARGAETGRMFHVGYEG